jgi:segregation and condensation protein A
MVLVSEKTASPDLDPHTLTELGIELLIDLAQRGEIDPWDVQVIDVIDNHLTKIPQFLSSNDHQVNRQTNLSLSGQAFLWAAMLVLLKADSLNQEPPESPIDDDDLYLEDTPAALGLPANLERHIHRRLSARPLQHRPVTLQDLILQLRSIASRMSDRPVGKRKVRHANLSASKAAKAIAELAHGENLTEMAEQLEVFLQVADLDWIDLEELIALWVKALANDQGEITTHDRVGVFWALLLLSAQSKVELSQEEFYRDLKVRSIFGELVPPLQTEIAIAAPPALDDN